MKRRYQTEAQILAAIDRNKEAIKVVELEMDKLETVIKHYRREQTECWMIEDAERRKISAHRSLTNRTTRLERLKEKLSEFRTPQIPAIDDGDCSIPA